jgi:hypothetical protein
MPEPEYEVRIRVAGPDAGLFAAAMVYRLRSEYLPAGGWLIDEPLLVNPPGSTAEQLPPEVLASRPARPYTSTACLDAGWYNVPDLHGRCRLNEKFTGQPCGCPCHEEAGGG